MIPYGEFVALVAALMALNALAIDIMLPALQQIGAELGVEDPNDRQFVVTAYIVGLGLAQLVYGPLSDRFGRRATLLGGLAIYTVAAVLAVFTSSFTTLLVLRVIQGIGAASTRVVAVAVVRDLYGGPKMASVMSLAMMVFMAVPILAPGIGQIVLLTADWHGIFALIALLGVVMTVWSYARLPETLSPEARRPLDFGSVAQSFRIVLTNREAMAYTLSMSLIFGALFAFLNTAQQIYTEIFGLGVWFPVAFSGVAVFIAGASFLNSRLVERAGIRRLSHGALVAFITLSGLTALFSELGLLDFWAFYGMMTAVMFCFGFIGTNFNALAMEPLGHVAGTASSAIGFIQTIVGGVLGALIGQAYDGTVTPLVLGYAVLGLAGFLVVLVANRGRLFTVPAAT